VAQRPGPSRLGIALAVVIAAGSAAGSPSLSLAQETSRQPAPAVRESAPSREPDLALPPEREPEAFELIPPTNVFSLDTPNDRGESITVRWSPPPVIPGVPPVSGFEIWRVPGTGEPEGEGILVGEPGPDDSAFVDARRENPEIPLIRNGTPYRYRVVALYQDGDASSDWGLPTAASPALFHTGRANALIILLVFVALLSYFILGALRGRSLFIRKIAGLSAIEEAVGRATEMGKAVLYVPGSQEVTDIQTIYSMVILHAVAKTVARYGTPLIVPVGKAFVVPLAEETVRQGYLDAGHPEAYNPSNVRYLSDEQFAFTAGVDGIMLREKPAANLFLGSFYAESLILAETGFASGAIQIAGTANIHQLPFFVVACDYALIGEEFFAATAYLSREPRLLGSLKSGDWMKVLMIATLLIGALLMSAGIVPNFPDYFTVQ
jgi:hypothetical protein